MTIELPPQAVTCVLTGPRGPSSLVAVDRLRDALIDRLPGRRVSLLRPPIPPHRPPDLTPQRDGADPAAVKVQTPSVVLIDCTGPSADPAYPLGEARNFCREACLVLWLASSAPTPNPSFTAQTGFVDRAWLLQERIAHSVVHTLDATALDRITQVLMTTGPGSEVPPPHHPRWRHWCGRCGDPGCEKYLFPSVRDAATPRCK